MNEKLPSPPTAQELLDELRLAIQRLYRRDGEPSTREIALRLGKAVSHTTVSSVLKCRKNPRWGQLELVVEALGGDTEEFRLMWIAIRDAEDLATQPTRLPTQRGTALAGEVEVLRDHAVLRYDDGVYTLVQRRLIRNVGDADVNGYLVRIHVDRFPHFARLSEIYHLQYPLQPDELNFAAWHGLGRTAPLGWVKHAVTSSVVERWLRFDGAGQSLRPGDEAWIEYEYQVSRDRWGNWFQRAIKHRTQEVSVTVDFPVALVPDESCVKVRSFSTGDTPGRYADADVAITSTYAEGRSRHTWSKDFPPLHARYRTEWSFPRWPTTLLAAAGIAQYSDDSDALTRRAQPVDLATGEARSVAGELAAAADRVARVHRFTGGMGLAAPQIGVDRQVVLLRTGTDQEFLVNPAVTASSGEGRDFEGCLSFFDARGELTRPTSIDVTYRTLDGDPVERTFTGRYARDVLHEIDHLNGVVFVDRMTARDRIMLAPALRDPDEQAQT